MDFLPYILGTTGTVFCALTAISFTRPTDYLAVFHPIMKHVTTMASGALLGIGFANMAALTPLTPLIDTLEGGPAALAEVRSLPLLAFVIFGVLVSATVGWWYLAATMHNRSIPPSPPPPAVP